MNVLITGATGFVGRFLSERLLAEGWSVRGTVLSGEAPNRLAGGVDPVEIEPLGPCTSWKHALENIDTVIHLAARVHIMEDPAAEPLVEFRRTNTQGTEQLARESVKAGVRRLVFVSSVKVNGEESCSAYTEDSPLQPVDPYGISKMEAEILLRRIESQAGLEVVVVRPPLVYGPGVKANFLRMMEAVRNGVPLPCASIRNKRSLVYVGNLVDALAICARHSAAAGQTYLVSDGTAVSTPELIRLVATAVGVRPRMFPFPSRLMRLAGTLIGKSSAVDRLLGSLTVNNAKIFSELGWAPPFTMNEGLRETATWFESIRK